MGSANNRGVIQFLVILIGVLFESARGGNFKIYPFIVVNIFDLPRSQYFGDSEMFRAYIYYICEHIKEMAIVWMMATKTSREFYKLDRLFLLLVVADFIDYILSGNNIWFYFTVRPMINGLGIIIPISMNVFSVSVFGFYVLKSWRTNG